MNAITDVELKEIVEKVVSRTLNGEKPRQAEAGSAATGSEIELTGSRIVAIGADHGGYKMKEMLIEHLMKSGYKVFDCGTDSTEAVDYPDFAFAVAEKVSQGQAWRGIVIDGAGIGSCMAANKVPGVRAAMCYDYSTAVNSREHNDANVLTLGAGLLGDTLVRLIVDVWLKTELGGERHARRVAKITTIEKKYLKPG
ncbi:MAG: ribose 5-phosphate isomerase B [Anaerolineales bacterium]|nr:ribose 5-phosphate isomerase B [Anaerolineales bacterium]